MDHTFNCSGFMLTPGTIPGRDGDEEIETMTLTLIENPQSRIIARFVGVSWAKFVEYVNDPAAMEAAMKEEAELRAAREKITRPVLGGGPLGAPGQARGRSPLSG